MDETQQNKAYRTLEIKKSGSQKKRLVGFPLPPFDLGVNYLHTYWLESKSPEPKLWQYADEWFKKPEKYLCPEKTLSLQIEERDNFLLFPSVLDNSQITKFKYNPQPNGHPGRKVALIHVMHWNGRLKPYDQIIRIIRNTALPISTLLHIPAGRGLNPGDGDPADYDSIGPNIGKTIFRARQDIQDLQFLARHLKEKKGYEQVGLFTYSIGSLRGIIAAMMSPGLFDFGIFHMVADDFTEAVMDGVATTGIADKIRGEINPQLLQKLWSTISPGSYLKYFSSLPKNTRIIQCKYDFVFGLENVKKFSTKVIEQRPDVELETSPLSHTALGSFPTGWKVMLDNIRYIYEHTRMSEYKRAVLFTKK